MNIYSKLISFFFIICLFLSLTPNLTAKSLEINKFEKVISVGSDSVRIAITSHPVNPEHIDTSAIDTCKILPCLGGFPYDLTQRIGQFDVIWNEEPIHIREELYEDCFTPVLNEVEGMWALSEDNGGILVLPGKDGHSVLIMMQAYRSACCGYTVWWIIKKNGQQTRFIDDSIP